MFFDWVMGIIFRPSNTFERSRQQLRFGYWWIVLSVMTLDCVITIFHPRVGAGIEDWSLTVFQVILQDLVFFDVQALLLLGAGRMLGWHVNWPDVVKLTGLLWSIMLLEDLVSFYPSLRDMTAIELWVTGLFGAWYVIVGMIGIRRLSQLSAWKSAVIGFLACGIWQGGLFVMTWYVLTHPVLP